MALDSRTKIAIITCLITICVLLLASSITKNFETFGVLDHPSKCFSCERDITERMGPEWAWMGQDTKSFDAEREMIRNTNDIASAFATHPIRYY